jgi:lysophospholipid acyltransferase (LPLAT)-like uncharacterized protein
VKKLLKQQWFSTILAYLVKAYVWLLFATCKQQLTIAPGAHEFLNNKSAIVAVWHGRILVFPKFATRFAKFCGVVSYHGDAEIVSSVIKSYGHFVARGSSRRGGANALREVIAMIARNIPICVTPDGPKGPRFKLKGATVTLSAKHNIPVIAVCYSASRAIIFNSWDRFILPLPIISKLYIDAAEPVFLKDDSDEAVSGLEAAMLKQVQTLDKKANLKIDY